MVSVLASRACVSLDPNACASIRAGTGVGLGLFDENAISEVGDMCVNFSMELGANARDSAEPDVGSCIARARSGFSDVVDGDKR